MSDIFSLFSTYFIHIFWTMAFFLYVYSIYFDNIKIKKRHQYMSDQELMNRFFLAKRNGIIK